MASDRDLVSTEDHEINYLLKKWNKKESKKNREILISELKKFKKDAKYKPHFRKNFYKYVGDNKIEKKLEASATKGNKSETDYNQIIDEVRQRAYHLYEERMKNNGSGDEVLDWLQAEKEIKSKYKMS